MKVCKQRVSRVLDENHTMEGRTENTERGRMYRDVCLV